MKCDPSTKTGLWGRDFIFVTLANFFLFASFHLLTPTLPAFIQHNGGSQYVIGLVIGIFTISALIIRPFIGHSLDTMGKGKILLAGMIVFICSVVSYPLMTSVLMIMAVRIIHGLGWGISTTALGTIASDLVPAHRRGEGMGYFGTSINLSMATAPFFGIWIMDYHGFSTLFVISTISAIIGLLLVMFVDHSTPSMPIEHTESKGKTSLLAKEALFPSFLIMLMTIGHGGILSFITLYGAEVGIHNVGWFFFANSIMVILSRPIAGKVFDKKGHQWVLIPGGISTILGLLLISIADGTASLMLAAVLYGIGFGSIQPTLQAWTINRVPPNRRGAANGTYFSAFDLGVGIGAMILGAVANWTGYALMYRYSSIFMVIFAVVYGLHLFNHKKRRYTELSDMLNINNK